MAYNLDNAMKVLKALIAAGAPTNVLPYLMVQVAHETGDFDSNVFRADNNATGISFINNPSRQKNARRGLPFPKKEGKYYYAHFATLNDWARDFLRIIGKSPQTATSLLDYATKLKKKGYYTDAVANYAKGLSYHMKQLKKYMPGGGSQFTEAIPAASAAKKKSNKNKSDFPYGIAAALVVGMVILTHR